MKTESQPFAPRRTAKPAEELTLTGALVPFENGQPCLINMPLSAHTYLPCFGSEKELRDFLARTDITFDTIKHVDNGREFLVSIPHHIIVIAKVRWTERGTVKFVQIYRD